MVCFKRWSRACLVVACGCLVVPSFAPVSLAATAEDTASAARQAQLEGARLQLQGKVDEAIAKYRESLALQPNERLETLVSKLENRAPASAEGATAVEPTSASSSTAPEVTEIEAVVQEKFVPKSPEEELVVAFTDLFLHYFPVEEEAADFWVETERNYAVEAKQGHYEVPFSSFKLHIEDAVMEFGPLILACTPEKGQQLDFTLQIPAQIPLLVEDQTVATLGIGKQRLSGRWDRTLELFPKLNMELADMAIQDEDVSIGLAKVLFSGQLDRTGSSGWQEQYQGSLGGLTVSGEGATFGIDQITFDSDQLGADLAVYADLQRTWRKAFGDVENMEKAEIQELFSSLETYAGLLQKYTSSLQVTGVHLAGEELAFELASIEGSSDLHQDADKRLVYASTGSFNGISVQEPSAEEGALPVTVSLAKVGLNGQGVLRPIPKGLFADIVTIIDQYDQLGPDEAETYMAQQGMVFVRKILALIQGYSAEITVSDLKVDNALPGPVTLKHAALAGGFDVGAGEGGTINLKLKLDAFEGMDMGAGTIPRNLAFNFALNGIPSLLDLISDPAALAEGGMKQFQGQVMQNGMASLLSSGLSLAITDSFVEFPLARLNLQAEGKVDGAAKFLSTGNLLLTVIHPEGFKQIVQGLTPDPDIHQMLATLTALASRSDQDGTMVDTIDAKIDQEGKVFINAKDVTPMFFPEVVQEPAGEPNATQEP